MNFSRGERRTNIIVNKSYQWRMTLIGVVYILATAIFLSIPFVYLVRAMNGMLPGNSPELIKSFGNLLHAAIFSGCVFIVSITAAWIYFSLKRSHKVVGPIVNIARIIDEFSKGNFSKSVTLRQEDELQEVAQALNNMAKNLIAREQILNERLIGRIRRAKDEIHRSPSYDGVREILAHLEKDIGNVLHENQTALGAAEVEKQAPIQLSPEDEREGENKELLFK